jgi:hypothetical protein
VNFQIFLPPKIDFIAKFVSKSQSSFDLQTEKMWKKLLVNVLLLVGAASAADNNAALTSKVICYYDSRAFANEGEFDSENVLACRNGNS